MRPSLVKSFYLVVLAISLATVAAGAAQDGATAQATAPPVVPAPTTPGNLVEGAKINPFTYEPKSTVSDGGNPAETDLHKALEAMGPVAIEWYQHVQTLSNPFFEGRVPGSRGNDLAAEYIQFYMTNIGLEPAFQEANASGASQPSWRQRFDLQGGAPVVNACSATVAHQKLDRGKTYQVIGSSGTGTVNAPLVFAGYAIETGQKDYTSFGPHDDFKGKVVMFLRYEPLDEDGRSLWSDRRFSGASAMRGKLDSLADRNPAAVILVNPPECKDGAKELEQTESSVFGPSYDFPIVQLSPEAADALLRKADEQGRGLMDFRRIADKGEVKCVAMKQDVPVEISVSIEEKGIPAQNVGGVLRGRGKLADEWLIIGAHYDHVGMGYFGADPQNRGKLHPGADDNASGTGAMLCTARGLHDYYASKGAPADMRSIVFLSFTAEEMGLDGSREFVQHPTMPADKIAAMINLDMVGRLRGNELAMSGTGTAEKFADIVRPAIERSGLTVKADPGGRGPSDHASFYAAGIPVLFLFTGNHDDYHKPTDKGFTVNPYGASKIVHLTEELAKTLATTPEKPKFTSTDGKGGADRGYAKVRLGIAPAMAKGDRPGLGVDSVSEGTSAADAGVQKSDVIMMWNDKPMEDAAGLMERLREHAPGDVVKLTILRDGKEIKVDVTLKASKK